MEPNKQFITSEQHRLLNSVNTLSSIIRTATNFWRGKITSMSNKDNSTLEKCSILNHSSCIEKNNEEACDEMNLSLISNSTMNYLNSTCANLSQSHCSSSKKELSDVFNYVNQSQSKISENFQQNENLEIVNNNPTSHSKSNRSSHLKLKIRKNRKNKKKLWKRVEEIKLLDLFDKFGENFEEISLFFPDRNIEEIKEKFYSKLNPILNTKRFSQEEDEEIIKLHSKLGNRWNVIAKYFPTRNPMMIKNRFYSCLKNRMSYKNTNLYNRNLNEDNIKNSKNSEEDLHKYQFLFHENNITSSGNNIHDINFDYFLNTNDSIMKNDREDCFSIGNFNLSEVNVNRENYNCDLLLNSNIEENLDENLNNLKNPPSLINNILNNSDLIFNNKDFCFGEFNNNNELNFTFVNENKNNNFNNNYEYFTIFQRFENLENLVKKMMSFNSGISDSYNLNKDQNVLEFENVKINLLKEIEILKETKSHDNKIPQNYLLKIIDILIQLTQNIKNKIEYLNNLKSK